MLNAVDKRCRDYLWSTSEEHKKIALVAWEKLCKPKKFGGLNIKGCSNWNTASVGKLLRQLNEEKKGFILGEIGT